MYIKTYITLLSTMQNKQQQALINNNKQSPIERLLEISNKGNNAEPFFGQFRDQSQRQTEQNACQADKTHYQILLSKQQKNKFAELAKEVQNRISNHKIQKYAIVPIYQLQTIKAGSKIQLYTFPKTSNSFILEYQYVNNLVSRENFQLPQPTNMQFIQKLKFWELYEASNRFTDTKQYNLARKCLQTQTSYPCAYIKDNSLGFLIYSSIQYNNSQIIAKLIERAIFQNGQKAYLINNLAVIQLQKDRKEAIKLLQLSLSIEPNVPALNNLANLFFQQGNYEIALSKYEQSLKIYENFNALVGIASIYAVYTYYQRSLEVFQKAKNYQSQSKMLINNIVQSYILRNDLAQAQNQLKKGLKLDPQYPYFHNSLGIIYYLQKKTQQSLSLFKKAIELQNVALFHSQYSICLIKANRPDDVLDYLRQITRPVRFKGEINLLQIIYQLLYKYRYQKILAVIDEFLPTQAESLYKVLNYKAYILAYTSQYQLALKCLQQALLLKQDTKILLNIATVQHCLQDNSQAMKYVDRVIELDPNPPIPYYFKGYLFLKLNNYEQSTKYLKHYLKSNPKSPQALNALAVCAYFMKNHQQAMNYLKSCLSIDTDHLPGFNNEAVIKFAQKPQSIANVHNYFPNTSSNNFPQIYFNLANQHFKARNYKYAISCYKRSIQLNQRYTQAYLNLGEAQITINQFKQGVKTFKAAYIARPDCYKCSILFSRNAGIFHLKRYCLRYMDRRNKPQADELKIILNLALMHKILRNDQQFMQLFQLSLQKLILSASLQNKQKIKQEIKLLHEMYCYLMSLFRECDAKDMLLVIGFLYSFINNLQEAQKYICAYISHFKLKKQALSDTFMTLAKRRFSKYSAEHNYRLTNCVIYHILKIQPQEGILCCIKMRENSISVNFQDRIHDLIEENRLKSVNQVKKLIGICQQLAKKYSQPKYKKQARLNDVSNRIEAIAQYICLRKYRIEQMYKFIMQLNANQQNVQFFSCYQKLRAMLHDNLLHCTFHAQKTPLLAYKQTFKNLVLPKIPKISKQNPAQSLKQKLKRLSAYFCDNFIQSYMIACYAYLQLQTYHQFYNFDRWHKAARLPQNDNKRSQQLEIKAAISHYLTFENYQDQQMSAMSLEIAEKVEKASMQEESAEQSSVKVVQVLKEQVKIMNEDQRDSKCQNALVSTIYKKKQTKQENQGQPQPERQRQRSKSLIVQARQLSSNNNLLNKYKKRKNLLNYLYLENQQNNARPRFFRSRSRKLSMIKPYFQITQVSNKKEELSSKQKAFLFQQQPSKEANKLGKQYLREVVYLRYVNTEQNTLFFNKLIYFSQIALIQSLQKTGSLHFAAIKIDHVTNNSLHGNTKFNLKKLNNYYLQYTYYVSKCALAKSGYIKSIFPQLTRHDLLQFIKSVGHIFIQSQILGLHISCFQLDFVIKSGSSYVYSNFDSTFKISRRVQQECHSYELMEILVAHWLSFCSSHIADEFVRNNLLKGLKQQKIKQLSQWKSKKAKSKQSYKQFNECIQYIFTCLQQAMKKDHSNQFVAFISRILKSANSQQLSQRDCKNICQLLKQAQEMEDAIPFIINCLTLIQKNQLQEQKQAIYYLGQLQIEYNHKLQTDL